MPVPVHGPDLIKHRVPQAPRPSPGAAPQGHTQGPSHPKSTRAERPSKVGTARQPTGSQCVADAVVPGPACHPQTGNPPRCLAPILGLLPGQPWGKWVQSSPLLFQALWMNAARRGSGFPSAGPRPGLPQGTPRTPRMRAKRQPRTAKGRASSWHMALSVCKVTTAPARNRPAQCPEEGPGLSAPGTSTL